MDQVFKLSDKIKIQREKKGLNKAQLANLLGISASAVGQFENGKNNPKTEVLLKLSKILEFDFINDNRYHSLRLNEPETKYRVTKLIEADTSTDIDHDLNRFVSSGYKPIPVYDNTGDLETISALLADETIKPVVLLMKGHLGCNLVVRHNDKAMDKAFPPRSQLGIQRVNNFKKRIIPGMAAIIVLDEYTITRYIYPGTNETELLFRSADQENFPDMTVDKGEIKEMWKIKSITREQVSEVLMY